MSAEPRFREARSLTALRTGLNRRWPKRDRTSDGGVGDLAHAARKSDHNPRRYSGAGPVPVYRARDIDADGLPIAALFEHLRKLGAAGFRPLIGGYLILNGRIAGTHTAWAWRPYRGSNPHTQHGHVSVGDTPAEFDAFDDWRLDEVQLVRKPRGDRWLGLHNPPMVGVDVDGVRNALRVAGNHQLAARGPYDRQVADLVRLFQRNRAIDERGVGPLTWAAMRQLVHGRRSA